MLLPRTGGSSPQQSPDTTCITPKTSPATKSQQKSPDLITCGECQTSFPLDNIIDFITHKASMRSSQLGTYY